jgi:hypothetical protein
VLVGALVERRDDLAPQIAAALSHGRPTVLDVRVDPDVPLPAATTWDLPPLATLSRISAGPTNRSRCRDGKGRHTTAPQSTMACENAVTTTHG